MKLGQINKKQLKYGYTTGSCAAAAARAAVTALLEQASVGEVVIKLPTGQPLIIPVKSCIFSHDEASCSVIKDAGDDPDITHGLEVLATVRRNEKGELKISGGTGIGTVTKPGLDVAIGMPAINPIPMKMIRQEIQKVMDEYSFNGGLDVIISAPKGEWLAKKTLNPRLGIVGGISILGTTGIVIPYSTSAYKTCISKALDVSQACGCSTVVLTTGRRSEKFAQNAMCLPEECYIQVGDYVGYAISQAARRKFKKIVIWGMIGKISKLANGKFYTHVSDSQIDFDFIMQVAVDCGIPVNILRNMKKTVTARYFYEMLPENFRQTFTQKLCGLAAANCSQKTKQKIEVECVLSDFDGTILGRSNV